MKKLVVLGNGGYSRTLQDVAEQLGYNLLAVLDDKDPDHPRDSFVDYISSSSPDDRDSLGEVEKMEFIPAFGNNELRLSWCDRITQAGARLAILIHPTAYISPTATINPGTVILPHAIVNTDVVINRGCIINLGAIVDHGCILEEGVHVCLGAIVKGENRIEKYSKIEAGEVVERGQYPL